MIEPLTAPQPPMATCKPPEPPALATMNILAYVHLRNIYRSTGAGRVARELIEHVTRFEDVSMHILADQRDHSDIVPRVGEPWKSFPYSFIANDTSLQQAKWLLLHRPVAERYWPKAHIVHCTGESYVPTSSSRLIVTVHDAAYFDRGAHPVNLSTMAQQGKWRLLYATLARTADVFHTVSHFSADRLAAVFPEIRSRLRVVHNGVSSQFFRPVDAAAKEWMRKAQLVGKRYVLLSGGLQYRKNADLVLKAWPIIRQQNPDLMLVIPGRCHAEYVPRAQSDPSIVLTGFLPDNCLAALYHDAQALWFPSRYEGFGLPVLEAMACGTPVVASNATAIPEIAGGCAILVSPSSVNDNVEAIETVVKDNRLRESLRAPGRRHAAQFTWTGAAAQVRDIYRNLM
jgi:glycosyltransferase involved in cell wall biosynthesis